MNEREQRGLTIAALSRLTKKGGVWIVPSQTGKGNYTVCPDAENPHCTCPDHEKHGARCKHIYAVEFTIKRETQADGAVVETRSITLTETRKTYPQNWTAYNAAQTNEKATFLVLLHNLCQGIEEPPQTMGRPRIPLRDSIFAACFKVYSTFSGRRFMTDLREAQAEGHIDRAPCYNSIFNVLESPATFDILKGLVVASAAPLKGLETNFACDSSGFSGCRYDRWYDEKYGFKKTQQAWVKAHIMCGVKTNVITAVEIPDYLANDGAQMPALVKETARTFRIGEVSGDLAYSTEQNLETIEAIGAAPMIPFKKNASPAKGGLWAKMLHYFQFHRDEFLGRYHQRSNVESTFSAVKRKFGDSVRSKTDVAMRNEVLAKFVCHNIVCVIHEMFESGVDPTFWAGSPVAQNVVKI